MSSEINSLEKLMRAVAAASPQLADVWETTAIIESLGYTDRAIEREFGFANALALGEYVFEQLRGNAAPAAASLPVSRWQWLAREMRDFIEQFSRSFIYALPWIVMFIWD